MFNNFFDFFIDFSKNIVSLLEWLFFINIEFTINGITYELLPVGLLVGVIALSVGIIRRIL